MGIIRGGILGGFRNKTGNVIGSYWRTKDVIKGLPRISGKAKTQTQKDQMFKFGMVTRILSYISNLIEIGYATTGKATTPMNDAVAEHLATAVAGVSPVFTFDFTKLQVSKGTLKMPGSWDVEMAPNAIKFSWMHNEPDDKLIDATDVANLLVYCPELDRFVSLMAAAPRSAKTFTLPMPADFSALDVHCYMSFTSARTKLLRSNTMHLGLVTML